MQQNYLMEEVLQGKRILDDVMTKKVPHLSRLNLFPFSFSFLRQLDKEALNQYLEQLQNMWEAYLRTKGTIQQPLFLQHLDFLQQIQIWFIKNNVLSNNTIHTRLRPARPASEAKDESTRDREEGKEEERESIEDEDEDKKEMEEEEEEEEESRYKRRDSLKSSEESSPVEKVKERRSKRAEWEDEWRNANKHKKHKRVEKKHRREREHPSRKYSSKKKKEEKEEEGSRKKRRNNDTKRKKRKSKEDEDEYIQEEEEKEGETVSGAPTYKRKLPRYESEELSSFDDDENDDEVDVDESAGFAIFSHRGKKQRNSTRAKFTSEEDILSGIVDTDIPTGKNYTSQQLDEFQLPTRQATTLPLSTLTTNHLQLYASSQPTNTSPRAGPTESTTNEGPTPSSNSNLPEGETTRDQSTLSYRDASHILLHSKSQSYNKYSGQITNDDAKGNYAAEHQLQQAHAHIANLQNELHAHYTAMKTHQIQSLDKESLRDKNGNRNDENRNSSENILPSDQNNHSQMQVLQQRLLRQQYEQYSHDQYNLHQQKQQSYLSSSSSVSPSLSSSSSSSSSLSTSGSLSLSSSSGKSEKRLSRYRSSPSKALLERMDAAIASRMHVLNRYPIIPEMELTRKYTILGTTGSVYTISISNLPSCNCPDSAKGHHCCHILFVLLKILKVSQHEAVLYQRALLNAELREIYKEAPANPSDTISLPPFGILPVQSQLSGDCPVCCEPFAATFEREAIVFCKGGCGANVHKSCFDVFASHVQHPRVFYPDQAICPVCERDWIFDSNAKPTKKITNERENNNKQKRGKKDKVKSSSAAPL